MKGRGTFLIFYVELGKIELCLGKVKLKLKSYFELSSDTWTDKSICDPRILDKMKPKKSTFSFCSGCGVLVVVLLQGRQTQ